MLGTSPAQEIWSGEAAALVLRRGGGGGVGRVKGLEGLGV